MYQGINHKKAFTILQLTVKVDMTIVKSNHLGIVQLKELQDKLLNFRFKSKVASNNT